jgi:hypothetical protein
MNFSPRTNLLFLPATLLLFSCSQSDSVVKQSDPPKELTFKVVDSIMVDILKDLTILDYQASSDRYLMKELRGGQIVVTDGAGNVVSTQELAGEGPNLVPNLWEGRFFGEDGYIFKEMSATMDFHVYDADFQKTKKIQGPAVGLNAIFISFYRQTFSLFEEDGNICILGEEVNSYDGGLINHEKLGGRFYDHAKTGYLYDLSRDSITYLNLFPANWLPRKTHKWIGQSFPFIVFNAKNRKVAVLPPLGDELFLYNLKGNSLEDELSVSLKHPDRSQPIPDPSREHLLYPSFTDLKMFGEYQLLIFHSAVPEEVYQEFRSKGENYQQDPDWRKAVTQYRKTKYIVVKDGVQLGISTDLPVKGNVNFGLEDGSILVKASEGDTERDYNLFYRLKLVEK